MAKLYVWANPVRSAPLVDHTWVTDYDITKKIYRNAPPKGKNYWYCWGSYHKSAEDGMLLSASGALKHAKAIVLPNVKPPPEPMARPSRQDGSITFYAIDGLCQQVANQVLYVTGLDGSVPQRVCNARGYHLATFFYRNYGLNDRLWNKNRKAYCPGVAAPDDDFVPWLNGDSGADLSKNQITRVSVIRTVAQGSLHALRTEALNLSKKDYEYAVGFILFTALLATAGEVGEKNFFKLFPSLDTIPKTTDDIISLLDTDQMEVSVKACRQTLKENPQMRPGDL